MGTSLEFIHPLFCVYHELQSEHISSSSVDEPTILKPGDLIVEAVGGNFQSLFSFWLSFN